MAQGAVAPGLTNGAKKLTAEELHEILECEKIIQFRDAVIAGTHPRIKVPAHLVGKPRHVGSPQPQSVYTSTHGQSNLRTAIAIEENVISNGRADSKWTPPDRSNVGKAPQSEINPILLEKSDDLIKAEIQLRRQRLERALREQIEQRRISLKASLQTSESLPDFDISEVLSKALSIVYPPADVEGEQLVGISTSAASDSFDENTFYSSQHDTPGLSSPSLEGREAGESEVQQTTMGHSFETIPSHDHDNSHNLAMKVVSARSEPGQTVPNPSQNLSQPLPSKILHPSGIPGLGRATVEVARQNQSDGVYKKDVIAASSSSSQIGLGPSLHVSISDGSNEISSKAPQDLTDLAGVQPSELLKRKFGEMVQSPESNESSEPAIIQARNELSPLAPQPARISPLATARGPPLLDQNMIIDEAPPAQVAALRKESDESTPDSSPKGSKQDKKKKKKKSRKSTGKESTTVATPNSPFIKPEPLSPSPFIAAPLQRPKKRQRQAFHHGQELNYDEPRYDSPREEQPQRVPPNRYREPAERPVFDRPDNVRMYEPRETEHLGYRQVREEPQYRRVVSHEQYRSRRSPDMYSTPHVEQGHRQLKTPSYVVTERVEPPRHYRNANLPPEVIRIDLDSERSRSPIMRERRSPLLMAPPPRMAPMRVVVDEYGRQYYDPGPAPSVSRQSFAPSSRAGGEDNFYERPPRRPSVAPSLRAGIEDSVYERALPRQSIALPLRDGGEDSIYERALPRQSVAPSSRAGGDDAIYERPPLRILNRPVAEVFEEDGVMYRRTTHAHAAPRRVVTQPDLDAEYRSYRQREYSARPVAMVPPSEDFVRVREAPLRQISRSVGEAAFYPSAITSVRPQGVRDEGQQVEEVPREYVPRVGSVRPEQIRHEIPRESFERFQSVRPEVHGREYTGIAHSEQRSHEFTGRPEARRDIMIDSGSRQFTMRPGEGETGRQEYVSTSDGGHSAVRSIGHRAAEGVEYRERPREVPQDTYVDEVRRIVYK